MRVSRILIETCFHSPPQLLDQEAYQSIFLKGKREGETLRVGTERYWRQRRRSPLESGGLDMDMKLTKVESMLS